MLFEDFKNNFIKDMLLGKSVCVVALPGCEPRFLYTDKRKREHWDCCKFVASSPGNQPLAPESTSYETYIEYTTKLVDQLRQTGGKTVIARVITLDVDFNILIDRAFKCLDFSSTNLYRAILYHPRHGIWVMDSPELLCQHNAKDGTIASMSLAGTRPLGTVGDWDIKNLCEQEIVTNFVLETLKQTQITGINTVTDTFPATKVEHIRTRITGKCPPMFNFPDLLDNLSPTPALCGYPRRLSLDRIVNSENFDRGLYGGYIRVTTPEEDTAFVVLRCARLWPEGKVTIYAGGGITPLSNPHTEWEETCAKAAPMVEAFTVPDDSHMKIATNHVHNH